MAEKYFSKQDLLNFQNSSDIFGQTPNKFIVHWFLKDTNRNYLRDKTTGKGTEFFSDSFTKIPWIVQNITLPTWNFKKEVVPSGIISYSFPVLEVEGFEFTVLYSGETHNATVQKFVNWCQRKIIDEKGFYRIKDESVIGDVIVQLINRKGDPSCEYVYRNVYYLRQTEITMDYAQDGTLPISVTFGCDNLKMNFYDNKYESEFANNIN